MRFVCAATIGRTEIAVKRAFMDILGARKIIGILVGRVSVTDMEIRVIQ